MALSKITADSLGANAVTANAISNTAVTTALGFTPANNTSSGITTALGFTPANKAGDTFTGNVVFSANATITGAATFSNNVTFSSNSAITLPIGTTAQRPGSPAAGNLRYNSNTSVIELYNGSTWATTGRALGTGENPARSAKELLDNGYTSSGLYFLSMHGSIAATQHYCLLSTSIAGGGWTLLLSMSDGNGFASGTNYAFNVTTGTPSITADYGLDRRNTFVPASGDEFMIRREDTNDWVRFVVTTWSPTVNNITDKWATTKSTDGTDRGHPYWALGQMYNSSGSAVTDVIHFNGCALGGNCGSGNGDGAGFGNYISWLYGTGGSRAWGGGYNNQSNGGSPLYWDTTGINGTRLTYWYRKAGVQ